MEALELIYIRLFIATINQSRLKMSKIPELNISEWEIEK